MQKTIRALVVTALPLEFGAMRAQLRDVRELAHPLGTLYDAGILSVEGCNWEVILVEAGATNGRAASETERALTHFQPQLAFFVGVAGGLKDVAIGDVVAATKVYGYEVGKADVELKPRLDFGQAAYKLEQVAKAVARQGQWPNRILPQTSVLTTPPTAFVAPIASGEKVVSSAQSAVYIFLKQNCSDALAVEMEGYGFLSDAHAHTSTDAIVVRGISDLVEGKADADAAGSQPRAAQHAAAFVVEMLAKYAQHFLAPSFETLKGNESYLTDEWWAEAIKALAELYDLGPIQDKIWERAGGDIAQLEISQTGRSQWFGALKKLRQGGGGERISLGSLLRIVEEDYPKHPRISQLLESMNEH